MDVQAYADKFVVRYDGKMRVIGLRQLKWFLKNMLGLSHAEVMDIVSETRSKRWQSIKVA